MTGNKKVILILLATVIVIIGLSFNNEVRAQTYYATGTLISKNLFSTSDVVGSIDYFGYNCTTTATTTLKVQFSQDNSNWYSATHTAGVWNTLSNGNHLATGDAISLSGWSAEPNFYYKMQFETSDTSTTPVLDEIRVYWTQGTAPTVTTATTSPVYVRSAVANGNVTDDGGGIVTTRGFKYGLTETDTWSVSETGSFGEGAYSLNLTNLEPNTTYYVRAHATNGKGTSYGSYVSFTTDALSYYSSGTLISKNLFSGEEVVIINNFYASSTVPAGTALWVQFSTTSEIWYSADGVQDVWTFVSDGQAKFILYNLNWSGHNFYYKMKFETNEAGLSPVLNEIILNYNLFHSPYLKGSIRIKGGVILK
ncbi:MAG: fibronectin type III domain-containing protein [Candidatus Nealsonbacteria bacterium]|nr:fibronectin type III domain-containing protein [Candidatus Nealsonbacteria bacterium]